MLTDSILYPDLKKTVDSRQIAPEPQADPAMMADNERVLDDQRLGAANRVADMQAKDPGMFDYNPQATNVDMLDAAALGSRVATILDQLRPTIAGSESRRLLVLELLEVLQGVSSGGVKVQRKVARAFVDSEGPELVYHLESSMSGNWVADAKNGTMKALSGISRLPGPIGHAMLSYRRLAEKNKLDAADQRCSHPGENPHGPRR